MEDDNKKNSATELLSMLGKLIAVIMIVRYALLIIHTYYPFLPSGVFMDIMAYINIYAPITLMVVIALSAVWDRSEVLRLVMLVISVAIIICSFFPDVRTTIEQFAGISQNVLSAI